MELLPCKKEIRAQWISTVPVPSTGRASSIAMIPPKSRGNSTPSSQSPRVSRPKTSSNSLNWALSQPPRAVWTRCRTVRIPLTQVSGRWVRSQTLTSGRAAEIM